MNLATFRYICVAAWVLLIGLLPFIVTSSTYFPYITGKNLFFRAVVEVLLVLWMVSCIRDKALRPKWSWLLGIFAGFIVWVGISDFLGINPSRSLWSNFERMEGYITFLHLFALFLVSATSLTKDMWYKLIGWSVMVSGITWIQGMVEHVKDSTFRIDGAFGNAIYFAAYALIHVFFAVLLAVKYKAYRYVWGAFAIANLVTILYTGTRGALLGFIGGAALALIIYVIKEWNNKKIRNISLIGIGVIVLVLVILGSLRNTKFMESSPILFRFSDVARYIITFDIDGLLENAGRARITVWSIAWEGVKDRPITGWGQENFLHVFSEHYNPRIFDQEQWFDRTHNVFLDWLIAAGFVGLIGYLGIFAAMLWYLWKRNGFNDYEKIVITGLIAAYFIHTFFVFDNITTYIFIMLILALVQRVATEEEGVEQHKSKKHTQYVGNAPLLIVAGGIGAIVLAWCINIPVYTTSANLIKGLAYAQGDGTQPASEAFIVESRKHFERALSGANFAQAEVHEAMVNVSYSIRSSAAATTTRIEYLNFIGTKLNEYVDKHSNDVRALYFAGIYSSSIGDYVRAVDFLGKALAISEKKQTIMFVLADSYDRMGNKAEALKIYQRAFEADPSFLEPRARYAIALIAAGRNAEAKILMQDIPIESLYDRRYTSLLIALDRYDALIDIFKKEVEQNPGNIQARVSLAAAYVEAGQGDAAIEILQTIIRDVPGSKAQVEFLISEIRAGRNPVQR